MAEQLSHESHITDSVEEIRRMDPGIGCLKLWLMLKDMFQQDWMPGRDRFFEILRSRGYVLKRPKPRHTTNSNHRYHKYKNLIKGFIPTGPDQLWVSDITYIDTESGNCYLHLVTDAYSHKIVGWCLAETLEALNTIAALRDAILSTGKDDLTGLIHHSDRGVQYCCNDYVAELNKYHIAISMTEDYKPTDNAIAERVNGILKTEVIYRTMRFASIKDALRRISEYISFYNNKRPHMSIGMQTPEQAHQQTGEQKRLWKKKIYKKPLDNEDKSVSLSTDYIIPQQTAAVAGSVNQSSMM